VASCPSVNAKVLMAKIARQILGGAPIDPHIARKNTSSECAMRPDKALCSSSVGLSQQLVHSTRSLGLGE
jgi:hypothetical protein